MTRGRLWLGAGVLLVLAAGGAATWVLTQRAEAGSARAGAEGQKGDKKPEVALEFTPREVVQPQRARIAATLEFSGPLVAPGTAIVRAKAGGTLLSLAVAEGSRVQAGQALGRIDLAEIGTRVAERSAQLESARAALAQAERTHASNEGLAAQRFISPVALDNSKSAVETARAQLAAAQAALDSSRVSLRDAALLAPISGIVAKRQALPGERLAPEQPLLTIVDLSKLELAGSVGTHEVARLKPGMPVSVQVEGVGPPLQGQLARIAPAAEPGTRSIGVTIEIANAREQLRAGQYAVARVLLADGEERLTLPQTAVGSTAGQDHVWVIDNGALLRRAVMLGRRDEREGRVEVLSGVSASSLVLAARFDNLREGAKASVAVPKASPMASAAASTPVLR